jgi:hypothetical protein
MATATPTVTATVDAERIRVSINNPAGGSPVVNNTIERRLGDGGPFTRIGVVGEGQTFSDFAVASYTRYHYRVRATGADGSLSDYGTVTPRSSTLVGIWVHDPNGPSYGPAIESTVRQFRYKGGDTSETLSIEATAFSFLGRSKRSFEMSTMESSDIEVELFVPFDANAPEAAEYWRTLYRSRRVILYRDSRER